jgi:anti-sigma B factor antagonist
MEELQLDKKDGVCIIRYSGELTLEITPQLKKKLEEPLESGECRILVMDLSKTVFMDSSGIGFLVALNNRIRQKGDKFILLSPSPQVRKTLTLVKLIDYFETIEDEDDLSSIETGE